MLCAATSFAQLGADGYYRIQNVTTQRYIYATDGYGAPDYTGMDVDAGALKTCRIFDGVINTEPGSIIYFQKSNDGYNLLCQGISTYPIANKELSIWDNGDGTYKAYGAKEGVSKYLRDIIWDEAAIARGQDDNYAEVTTGAANHKAANWYIIPVSSDNYLGIKPDVVAGTSYYRSYCVSFPFELGTGMQAFTITTVDESKGYAVYQELTGTIPAATPVFVKCTSAEPVNNKITITGTPVMSEKPIKSANNLLTGIYFCNFTDRFPHFDAVTYNAATMRVLGTTADGQLAFIKATDLKYIPANSCYIEVSESAPDTILIVDKIPEEPQPTAGDLDGDDVVNVSDLTIEVSYILNSTYNENADLDHDGKVDVSDLTILVNMIMNK